MKRTLKSKIRFAILMISFISVTISTVMMSILSTRNMKEQYEKMAEENLAACNLIVDRELDMLVSQIRTIVLDDSITSALSRTTENKTHYFDTTTAHLFFNSTSELYMAKYYLEGVYMMDNHEHYYINLKNGKINHEYLQYYQDGIDAESEWYQQALETKGKEIFINGDVLNEDNNDVFSIVKSINTKSDFRQVGMVILTFRKTYINAIYNQLSFDYPLLIFDDNYSLISAYGMEDGEQLEAVKDSYLNFKSNGVGGKYYFINKANRKTRWHFVSGIKHSDLYDSYRYILVYIALLTSVLSVALVVVSMLVSESIYKPLKYLEKAVNGIGKGEGQINAEFDNSEIGQIGQTLKNVVNENLNLQKKVLDQELEAKRAEYQILLSQINPHYLYNTLNSIYTLTLKYKADDIGNMVKLLSDMFRMSLDNKKDYTTIRNELTYIDNYVKIMRYRFGEKIQVIYEIDDDILDSFILKFLMQSFVENSILHGIEPKMGNGTIVISGTREMEELLISIYDDGVGFDKASVQHGYGIHNVNERIKLVYGSEYGVDIVSTEGEGTCVQIHIPNKGEQFYKN